MHENLGKARSGGRGRLGTVAEILKRKGSIASILGIIVGTCLWRVLRIVYPRMNPALACRVSLPEFGGYMHLISSEITVYRYCVLDRVYESNSVAEVQSNWIVVEIGAHVGFWAISTAGRFSENSGGKIYALEPNPSAYDLLHRSVGALNLQGKIIPLQEAVYSGQGERQFVSCRHSQGAHLVGHGNIHNQGQMADGDVIDVMTVTLDKLVEREKIERIDLLKINVEGAELEVLRSGTNTALMRVQRVVISLEGEEPSEVVFEFLAFHGLHLVHRVNDLAYFARSNS